MNRDTLPRSLRVARRDQETPDIIRLELTDPEGRELPAFEAGAHVDVEVQPGLVRQYSLCNAPAERHRYVIGILRDRASRGGSAALHESAHAGVTLRVGMPRNLFPLAEGRRHVLVGAGIGITPILAMAQSLHARGADFHAHYFVRQAGDAAFADLVRHGPLARYFSVHADGAAGPDPKALQAPVAVPQDGVHLYLCGPSGFLDALQARAAAGGWAPANVHMERFGAAPAASGARPFRMVLARSGRCLEVPADRTALDVLLAAGMGVPYSCEQGVCGACLTPLIAGRAEHRDEYLSAQERAEGRLFLPCCSRAVSDELELDL